jgi:hypothetical protein
LSSKKLYAYGSDKPLTVAGSFIADVRVKDKCVSAEFFVVEEEGQTLLGLANDKEYAGLAVSQVLQFHQLEFEAENPSIFPRL